MKIKRLPKSIFLKLPVSAKKAVSKMVNGSKKRKTKKRRW